MGPKELLRMAKELDEMARSVTSDEADLLEIALKNLKAKKPVSQDVFEAIRKMYDKYLTSEEEPALNGRDEDTELEDEEVEE